MSLGMFRQSTVNQLLLFPFHKTRGTRIGKRSLRAEFDESLIHLPAEFIVSPDNHCHVLAKFAFFLAGDVAVVTSSVADSTCR